MNKIRGYAKSLSYTAHMLAVLAAMFLFSCSRSERGQPAVAEQNSVINQALERTNIWLIDAESQEIDDFIERYGWEMKETGTGLRYTIYERGTGRAAEEGMTALFNYSVFLLTGELVYSSEEQGAKHFRIGQGGVESGLEEGMLLLRMGDKARFILPSHLAHGVPGDGVRIPQRSTIIYEIELLDLI